MTFGFVPFESLLKDAFFSRLIKNAQMQGAREPFTCRSGRQSREWRRDE